MCQWYKLTKMLKEGKMYFSKYRNEGFFFCFVNFLDENAKLRLFFNENTKNPNSWVGANATHNFSFLILQDHAVTDHDLAQPRLLCGYCSYFWQFFLGTG